MRLLKYAFPVLWLCCSTLFAQVENEQVRIETTDGNEYIGTIVEEDNDRVVLETEAVGILTIKKINIKSREIVIPEKIKEGKYWFDNPQSTRYLWSPNGYGLKKGEGYYQNVWVLFNQVSVGVTDNFSIGFGTVPLFLFGSPSTPIWVAPKFSIPVSAEKFNLGVGALVGTVVGEDGKGFGLLYGITTFGSRDKNFSVGLGYGYSAGELADTPTLSFSALIRTSQRGYFITENYYIDTGEPLVLLSLGGRRIIKKVGLDFGAFIPISSDYDGFIAIPWLGITVPFGKQPN
jgi:small nuclear ribonucleoprotein (snRNP)-like protein